MTPKQYAASKLEEVASILKERAEKAHHAGQELRQQGKHLDSLPLLGQATAGFEAVTLCLTLHPQPQTRLSTSAHAIVVPLKAAPSLLGVTASVLNLSSEDGQITLKVPSAAFPNIHTASGDILIVSITIMKNVIEPLTEFEAGLVKGLDS